SGSYGYEGSATLEITADGKAIVVDTKSYIDTKYTYGSAVARIGDTYFISLDDAVNAAEDGDIIVLLVDVNCVDLKGKNVTFTGAKLIHTEVVDAAKEPTCVDTGLTEGKHCSVCGVVIVKQTEIPALGHKMTETPAKAATCTEDGTNGYFTCDTCKKVYKDKDGKIETTVDAEVIPALGHDVTKIDGQAATCTDAGWKDYYECSNCKEYFADADATVEIADLAAWKVGDGKISALGHDIVVIPGVLPTKTNTGLTEGQKCSVCGKILVAQVVIDAVGEDDVIIESDIPSIEYVIPEDADMNGVVINMESTEQEFTATITLPGESIEAVKGTSIQFAVEKSVALEDAYVFTMTCDDTTFVGEVLITLPYDVTRGQPHIIWVESDERMEIVSIDDALGTVTFRTTHNSTYQVVYTSESDTFAMTTGVIIMLALVTVLAALPIAGLMRSKKV
ncbi:MAG: hypothetical protein SPJ57_03230, partial [Candidatus Methanomethylophilaceae archaeon]|nr:hypothetical protein [Candidatus Methanomethylophilaceae archaeon]